MIPTYNTVPELREIAKKAGIKNTARKNEEQLLEALEPVEATVEPPKVEETPTQDVAEDVKVEEPSPEVDEEPLVEEDITNEDIEALMARKNRELTLHREQEQVLITELRELSGRLKAVIQKDYTECVKEFHEIESPAVEQAQKMAHIVRISMKRTERRLKTKLK